MAELLPIAEARGLILEGAEPLAAEIVAIAEAAGRVLARDLIATRTQPPKAVSAMDGYALRAAETPGALRVVGESAAGHPFSRTLAPGEAVRIFTGAAIPQGADAILVQEDARREGDLVHVATSVATGRHVRAAGLDFHEGEACLLAGTLLTPRAIGLAAAMNHGRIPVHRRPRVAILSTGDELVAPGMDPGPDGIVSSNAMVLAAGLSAVGAAAVDLGICPDRLDLTRAAIESARAAGHDILVTSGGASVGDHDHVQRALADLGADMGFWKIAMRPGKPMMLGRLGGLRVIGLPGNPVSTYVCMEIFVAPLVRKLSGLADIGPWYEEAVLGVPLPGNDLRADHLRATLAVENGALVATPHPVQDSSMIRVLARSNCLILRDAYAPPAEKGAPCRIIRL